MSKELTLLQRFDKLLNYKEDYKCGQEWLDDYDIIETALKALNLIYDKYVTDDEFLEDDKLFSIIEKALADYNELQKVLDDFGIYNTMNLIDTLKNIQFLEKQNAINSKKLKALEIIKEKDVNPIDIRCCDTVEQYNIKENGNTPLSQEEYNLLKEVLKDAD